MYLNSSDHLLPLAPPPPPQQLDLTPALYQDHDDLDDYSPQPVQLSGEGELGLLDYKLPQTKQQSPEQSKIPQPTKIRISTMTATCQTNLEVDLAIICHNCQLVVQSGREEGILKTTHAGEIRGRSRSDSRTSKKRGKVFYNQATLIIKLWKESYDDEVNLKLFNNGNIQMTGLKSEQDGLRAVNILHNAIKDLVVDDKPGIKIDPKSDKQDFEITKFDIVLINSDYSAEFLIKRDVLHSLLIQQYDIVSSYEPCTYPGVNSKFYWNSNYINNPKYKPGVCYCQKPCNGKGHGSGDGCCKKVTIAIFQSGKLIITGAKTHTQIYAAYDFINGVFSKHYNDIKREIPSFLLQEDDEDQDKKKTKTTRSKSKSKIHSDDYAEDSKKKPHGQQSKSKLLTPPEGAEIRWINPKM